MQNSKVEIQKAIREIENPYPGDDLIITYSDFLKTRDYLGFYKFNSVVFANLVYLVNILWKSDKRINRLSLVRSLKKYWGNNTESNSLSLDVRKQLFKLFQNCFEQQEYLHKSQTDEIIQLCNVLLINISLTEIEEIWLCKNATKSDRILNRVLRYPTNSSVISAWARNNLHTDYLRCRRAELLSWVLDEDQKCEVDKQTLINDFEYLNNLDYASIKGYDEEIVINDIIKRELSDYLPKYELPLYCSDFDTNHVEFSYVSNPELRIAKRFYPVPVDGSKAYPVPVPDFVVMRHDFLCKLDVTFKITMIWAIAYSRLNTDVKTELLMKYYCDETYRTFLKICRKYRFIDLLKELIEKEV